MIFTCDEHSRLDTFLTTKLPVSRSQISTAITKGSVLVNSLIITKNGHKLKPFDTIELIQVTLDTTPPTYEPTFDIPILYEDDHLLIINKPAGVVVHGASSVKEATVVDWLKKHDFRLSTLSGEERHGIVHRLDKETSGALVIAKTNDAHARLSEQLKNKTMGRYYIAIIDHPLKESTFIDKPLGRNPHNRLKMGVVSCGRNARTYFHKGILSDDGTKELIFAKLFTGRTHQIRVHLQTLNRHIIGDSLYGFKGECGTIKRHLLHAFKLYLIHPLTKEPLHVMAPLSNEWKEWSQNYFTQRDIDETVLEHYCIDLCRII